MFFTSPTVFGNDSYEWTSVLQSMDLQDPFFDRAERHDF